MIVDHQPSDRGRITQHYSVRSWKDTERDLKQVASIGFKPRPQTSTHSDALDHMATLAKETLKGSWK